MSQQPTSSKPAAFQHNSASPKLEVAIAGGGIAGFVTAIALLKHPGINVQIYERAEELREIGASIGLGPNGLSSLDKLGVQNAFEDDILYRQKSGWPHIYRHWKTGEIIDHDEHHDVKNPKHFTTRYHRAHLHRALYENLPNNIVHFGKKLIDVSTDPEEGVTLSFQDGTVAKADICIGSDGVHSVVRKTFVPAHTLRWTGWVALRAVYDISSLDGVEYSGDAAHWVGHGRHLFQSPLARLTLYLGKGLFTVVGDYHSDPNNPNAPGQGVKWDDEGDVERFRELYKDWHPSIRAFTQAAPYIRQFPNYVGDPLERWSFEDRVVLVGDAAHGHGGAFAAGGSLAINDAHALSLALFHVWPASSTQKPSLADIRRIFQLYESTRQPQVNKLLGAVHKAVAGRKVKLENGKPETDEQLRQRVLDRMDPHWIAEHDVEAAFESVVAQESTGEAIQTRL
ncbi:Monooxygenase FAD-binding [Fusarium albosuccineum]|uniref:Monooxygenase FAD-binding n=1 Tax=Fusarium albosuccineum TaxID=1237068 RepID=A0A8H4PF48_9HYPO|nr:Monooxygenase FAD-binding [Fusarium albosuccineum]